jgi:hypothetical protein
MNNEVRQALVKLMATLGTPLIEQPRRLRALLSDQCPGFKREINVLLIAVEQRIATELRNRSAASPWPILSGRLVRRLREEAAMAEEAACWVVESWGMALGALPRGDGERLERLPSEEEWQPGARPSGRVVNVAVSDAKSFESTAPTVNSQPAVQTGKRKAESKVTRRAWWMTIAAGLAAAKLISQLLKKGNATPGNLNKTPFLNDKR